VSDPISAAPQPDKAGIVEDFVDIFASPAQVFARRATSNPMVPFLIVSAILIGLFFASRGAMGPIFQAQMQKGVEAAMKANPQLTEDQMAKSRPMMEMSVNFGAIVIVPVGLLILGGITMGVGRVLGGKPTYSTALMIASFAWVPRIIGSLVTMIQTLTMDVSGFVSPNQLSLSAARFVDPVTTSNGMQALLARVDVFTIWVTVLLAIGLVAGGKMPKSKQWIAAALLFVIGSVPAIWMLIKG
jgi:uncharacterized membrane protein YkgB